MLLIKSRAVGMLLLCPCLTFRLRTEVPHRSEAGIGPAEIPSGAPTTQWHKGYGTDNGEHIHEIRETADGGFLGIGQTSENEENGSDLLVIKIDSEGDFLWQRIIGTEDQTRYRHLHR